MRKPTPQQATRLLAEHENHTDPNTMSDIEKKVFDILCWFEYEFGQDANVAVTSVVDATGFNSKQIQAAARLVPGTLVVTQSGRSKKITIGKRGLQMLTQFAHLNPTIDH